MLVAYELQILNIKITQLLTIPEGFTPKPERIDESEIRELTQLRRVML